MANYDSHSSRIGAIDEDEAIDDFYRPAAPLKTRASRGREAEPVRNAPRVWPVASKDDAEDREEDAFLRARRRVPIRRGLVPRSRTGRSLFAAAIVLALAVIAVLAVSVRNFLRDDPRFRIDSGSNIQIMGNSQVTRPELLSVFGSDIGRNIFFVPLDKRRAELERLPWVGRATVMRLLPNQLRVSVQERAPVAFLRSGNTIGLVDAYGVLLNMPPAMMAVKHYSFPVVTGISAHDPLPIRAARMRLYQQFIADLDSGGKKASGQLSEVDISDPEDIRALLPAGGSDILVHFGEGDFLNRYNRYQQHLAEWRRQYPNLASVDMRYESQVVLEMAKGATVAPGPDGSATSATQPEADAKPPAARPATHLPVKPAPRPVKPQTQRAKQHQSHNPVRSKG